uniref:Peptidase M12B domain-containing protein n=1 Tax=Ditylenchus dipsaci TaxID=166011 RepID=A0A915CKQ5_9BILA
MIFNQRTIRMVSKDECTANPDLTALCAKKDSFTHGICDNGDMVSLGPVFNVALIHLLDSFSNEYNLKNAITTVAHEFGHLLGANHDKITSYGYKSLMTAGPANEKDRKFSELSLKQILASPTFWLIRMEQMNGAVHNCNRTVKAAPGIENDFSDFDKFITKIYFFLAILAFLISLNEK